MSQFQPSNSKIVKRIYVEEISAIRFSFSSPPVYNNVLGYTNHTFIGGDVSVVADGTIGQFSFHVVR